MTVKTTKRPRWYTGPARPDADSPTGWSAVEYDLNDEAEYKAWYADWAAAKGEQDATPAEAPTTRTAGEHADAYEGDPIAKAREAEAMAWVVEYTDRVKRGDIYRPFGLIMDIAADRRFGSKWMKLSERQVEVILNSKARQLAWDAEKLEADKRRNEKLGAAPVVPQLPEGRRYYAVPNESGKLTFLRITRTKPDPTTGRPSITFVDQLIGGGSEETGNGRTESRGRVTASGQYLGTFESLYRAVVADPEAAMVRYGHEMGRCGYCGRDLTDEESRRLGIGPVCRQKGFE